MKCKNPPDFDLFNPIPNSDYTPVLLVESVENCGLCMRQCLASSSYAHVMHCALAITRAVGYDASVKL